MDHFFQDFRYTLRTLRRSPVFTVTAVLTLAIGIGATTAIFSLIDATLLRPLPVHQPDRLLNVEVVREDGSIGSILSYPRFTDFRDGSVVFSGMAAYGVSEFAFRAGETAEVVTANVVSGNFFEVLGIRPALGRFFAPEEAERGRPAAVAVISHDLWRERFGADPGVIGHTVRVNDRPIAIIGVAPRGFGSVNLNRSPPPDLWVPIALYPQLNSGLDIYTRGRMTWLSVFGRLEPGVTRARAEAALSAQAPYLPEENTSLGALRAAQLVPFTRVAGDFRDEVTRFLGLLFAAAGLVLLIAGVNVGGMLLARAATRRRELAIRRAVGAGRGRIARQLLTESVLLSLLGGAAGVLLAIWLGELVPALLPVPIAEDVAMNGLALGFTAIIALGTGVLFRLVPAWRASSPNLVPALKEAAGRGGGRARLRSVLVVSQVAMALLLLVSAGLLTRAVQEALSTDPGFDPEGVLTARIDLGPHGYEQEGIRAFHHQLLARVQALPGVESTSLAASVPMGGRALWDYLKFTDDVPIPADNGVRSNVVSANYFHTLGIPLLAGQGFAATNRDDEVVEAIVNQTFDRQFFPGESPLGKRFVTPAGETEVVGIVHDGKYDELFEEPQPFLYISAGSNLWSEMVLYVRTGGDPSRLIPELREIVRTLDPDVPLFDVASLNETIGRQVTRQRTGAAAIGVLGGVGLLLAAIGLYGLLAYSVGRRTHEIGVRLALGADTGRVLRMVLRQGFRLALVGMAVGILAAIAATRLLEGLLLGVSPLDPLTFGIVMLALAAVALLASYVPARRATRVDPMIALRAE